MDIYDNKDNFLATGHYQPGSIAVRILSFQQVEPDIDFFSNRIDAAVKYRRSLGLTERDDLNVFRLVNAEGDNLPGLIVDYYNGVAVMQIHSVGMHRHRSDIAKVLTGLNGLKITSVYDKSGTTLPYMSGIKADNQFIEGYSDATTVTENGYRFKVDWTSGQKTGFYIDQRENRKLLGNFTRNRRVLNMFAYTGGFSVYALKDAAEVHTVDSSQTAIDIAEENVQLNYGNDSRHKSYVDDAFGFLDSMNGEYDLIILDPPAFAKHNNVLANALQGYKRLNMKAIERIKPGGIIFSFSCSQVVSKENFRKSLFAASANTGRNVRILHQMGQPPDHPVNIYHPEGEYLKGLVLYVD